MVSLSNIDFLKIKIYHEITPPFVITLFALSSLLMDLLLEIANVLCFGMIDINRKLNLERKK